MFSSSGRGLCNESHHYCGGYISCITLRTLNCGNYGTLLIMGNAGSMSSTVRLQKVVQDGTALCGGIEMQIFTVPGHLTVLLLCREASETNHTNAISMSFLRDIWVVL